MKVTAIIKDETIKEVMKYSNASTITSALKIALNEYIRRHKLRHLSKLIKENPLEFEHSAEELRELNRSS